MVSASAAQTQPSTRARGQDDGSTQTPSNYGFVDSAKRMVPGETYREHSKICNMRKQGDTLYVEILYMFTRDFVFLCV